jgi:glycosyltransferase involved in cell wall biosynthesis
MHAHVARSDRRHALRARSTWPLDACESPAVPTIAVSLVVPCFQEEAALGPFAALLAGLHADEIVFVDDGSTDGTAARLTAMAGTDARVRVATHARNRGVGAATRTGLEAARGDVIVLYDADRTYPASDIDMLVEQVRAGADVASGSPLSPEGAMDDVPVRRRLLTRAASFAYRLVVGRAARGVSTFTCGFRAWRRSAALACLPASNGFPAAAEMLGRALLQGYRVVEHPAVLTTRKEGRSKMRVLRALAGHARTLVRLLWLRIRGLRAG